MSEELSGNGYLCSLYAEKVEGIYRRMEEILESQSVLHRWANAGHTSVYENI